MVWMHCMCCLNELGALQVLFYWFGCIANFHLCKKNASTPYNHQIKVICYYTHYTKTNSKPPKLQTSGTVRLQVRYMLHRKENILVAKLLL